jgi:hypothetical protein
MEARFSLCQDELTDPRHDALTRRVPDVFHSDEPDDRRTLPGGYGVEEGTEEEEDDDDDADTLSLDRVTLPSAREAPLLPPDRVVPFASLWLGLRRFFERITRGRAGRVSLPPGLPLPAALTHTLSSPSPRAPPVLQVVQDLVWTLDEDDLAALKTHTERVASLRKTGPAVYAEARILDALALLDASGREATGVPLSALRARMPEIPRAAFDEAILGLERKTWVALGAGKGPVDASAIWVPGRGYLGRCVFWAGRGS